MNVRRLVVLTMGLSLLAALCPARGSASVGADDTYGTWSVSRISGSWAEGRLLAGQSGPQATVAIDNRSESRNRDLWTAVLQKAGANGYPQTVTVESSDNSVGNVIPRCPGAIQDPLCFAGKGITVPVGGSGEWTVALSRPDRPAKVVFKATPDFRAAAIEFTSLVYKALATIFVTEALKNSGSSCASAAKDAVIGEGVNRLFDALGRSGALADEIESAVRAHSLGDLFARVVPLAYDILQGATLDPANSLEVLASCSAGTFSTRDFAKILNTGGILERVQLIWAVFTVTVQLEGEFLLSALRDQASPYPVRGGLDTMIVVEYTPPTLPPTLPPTRSPIQPTIPPAAAVQALSVGQVASKSDLPGTVLITLNPLGRRVDATIDLAASIGPPGNGTATAARCGERLPGTRPCESPYLFAPNLAAGPNPAFGSVTVRASATPGLPAQLDSQVLYVEFPISLSAGGPYELILASVRAANGGRYRVHLTFTLPPCPVNSSALCVASGVTYVQDRLP